MAMNGSTSWDLINNIQYFSIAMTKKNKPDLRLFVALLSICLILFEGTGCTRHHADNITQNGRSKGASLRDSLVAVWKLDKIEVPDAIGNVAAFGSETEREKTDQTLAKYQQALKGMMVTFNKDNSYQSVYNGSNDVGTWKINQQGDIETLSKISNSSSTFRIVSVTGSSLAVKYITTDGALLMTFQKK